MLLLALENPWLYNIAGPAEQACQPLSSTHGAGKASINISGQSRLVANPYQTFSHQQENTNISGQAFGWRPNANINISGQGRLVANPYQTLSQQQGNTNISGQAYVSKLGI